MRRPDCILVRVGEQALKSKQVRKRWMATLLDNIRSGLTKEKVKFRFEVNPNRIFVYTKQSRKAEKVLKKIFGITSFSLVWKCHSDLNEIKLLATDVAEKLKLNSKKSFAVRARRAGWHKFDSQTVAVEVGAAVKRVTQAKVDLSNPRNEIWVETRSRNTYIFTEYLPGVGGVPLGTAGKVLAILENNDSVIATWLVMKRGCQIIAKGKASLLKKLEKWHIGKKMKEIDEKTMKKMISNREIKAIVIGGETSLKQRNLLILRPLVGEDKKTKTFLTRQIG